MRLNWSLLRDFVNGKNIKRANDFLQQVANGINMISYPGITAEFAGDTAPDGWLLCDGAAISRTTYAALFAVIGTKYGVGDGSTTFNVPNIKGKGVVGYNSAEAEFDTLGKTGGEKAHTLTVTEIPAHTHGYKETNYPSAGGNDINGRYENGTYPQTQSTGGGGAHNNLQPYIVLNHIIKT